MSQVVEPSVAERGKAALDRHAWREAFELLSGADVGTALGPEELELLAQAAWWNGQLPVAMEARERSYAAAVKAGRPDQAVAAAIHLGYDNLLKSSYTVATAWLNRADRLLARVDENAGHGWLAATRALEAALTGDTAAAIEQATRAYEIAQRFGDRNLEVLALSCKGLNLVADGQVDEGMALLDEATVPAVAGELDADVAGGVCCATIGACSALGDWRRAGEWTEAQDRWCQREGINGYPGMCRLHRAEIKRIRGDWLGAEAEARRATDELEGFHPAAVGLALYEIGQIRLRRGDLPEAEDALLRADEYGRDPEPALSLVRLAQGRIEGASRSIKRALDEPRPPSWWAPPNSGLYRAWMLPAQVEIALAASDLITARAAADELTGLAERFGSTSLRATAECALGSVLVAEGDLAAGIAMLRRGIVSWRELDAPYEIAQARTVLAKAYAADGSDEHAGIELRSARTAFERLGATVDLRRADDALSAMEGESGRGAARTTGRALKTFVFTDIVDSTRFAALVGDEAWDKLLRWHDQALRSIVAEHGGQEVKATGDGFFLTFDAVDQALDAAIAIQRRLADQRQAQGFAPAIRIGIHQAEANRVGLDYTGGGVNQAARVSAVAAGDEILATASTVKQARRSFAASEPRVMELKGIAEPVEVVSIAWR
ncbi:MAG: adenylate/guanylate cyclase domain-containing protein [Chloroflexota bacterium]